MDFQRARTKEQVEKRQYDIISACDTLFSEGGYENVNMMAISQMTTITRSSIYTYYKTKDEIILDLLAEELFVWQKQLEAWIQNPLPLDKKEFSQHFTKILLMNEKMLQHYCLVYTLLEKNSRIEKLVEFKQKAVPTAVTLVQLLMTHFPEFSIMEASTIAEQIIALVIGLYPVSHLTERQKEAISLSGTGYQPPDFSAVCEAGIYSLLKS